MKTRGESWCSGKVSISCSLRMRHPLWCPLCRINVKHPFIHLLFQCVLLLQNPIHMIHENITSQLNCVFLLFLFFEFWLFLLFDCLVSIFFTLLAKYFVKVISHFYETAHFVNYEYKIEEANIFCFKIWTWNQHSE